MKKLVVLILILLSSYLNAQDIHYLEFTLKGMRFDSLRIVARDHSKGETVLFWNTLNNDKIWKYEMPDSIWSTNRHFVLGRRTSENKNRYEYVCFYDASYERDHERIHSFLPQITPDDANVKIEAIYSCSDTLYEDGDILIYHNFASMPKQSTGLRGMIKYPGFSTFPIQADDNSNTYKDLLSAYVLAVKDCPNSKFLAMKMLDNMNKYRSSNDTRSVYNCFSAKVKGSEYGKQISEMLSRDWTHFENINLKNVLTGQDEKITDQNKKFKLICFTASWCVNCRKEIPLLKEIYNDLKDYSFEMVYISVDRAEYQVTEFRKQIIADSIPWRSLLSYPLKIEEKYAINAYPTNMVVYPDNHIEFLDVRDKDKREKLYRLVKDI